MFSFAKRNLYDSVIDQTMGYTSLGSGVWTWFNSPEAIFLDSDTILAQMVDAKGDADPGNRLVSFNDKTGVVTLEKNTEALGFSATKDDHNNGALLKLSSGTLLSMAAGHPSVGLYLARATSGDPADLTSWSSIHTQTGTSGHAYCNLYELEGDPYQFGRQSTSPGIWYYTKSTDDGVTWSSRVQFMEGTVVSDYSCYMIFCRTSSERLDFLVTTGHPRTATNSVYHGYFNAVAGTFHKTDGTSVDISGGPAEPADFTLVYDGSSTNAWLWDLRRFRGKLYGLITFYPDYISNDWTNHRYGRVSLSGTTWSFEEVGEAGVQLHDGTTEEQYSGGCCFHPTDPDTVFGCYVWPTDRYSDLRKYVKNNGTWSYGTMLATDASSGTRVARPVCIPHSNRIMCFAGKYESFLTPSTEAITFDADIPIVRKTGEHYARAWRIKSLTMGNLDDNVQLGEVELRPTIGGATYTATGSAIGSDDFGGSYPPANAFDGNNATRWVGTGTFDHWIGWDAGVGNKFTVSEVFIRAYATIVSSCPTYVLLEYSDDASTWYPYCFLPGSEPLAYRTPTASSTGRTFRAYDCRDLFVEKAPIPYRYIRFDMVEYRYDTAAAYPVVEHIKIRDSDTNNLCITAGGTASASITGTGTIANVFVDDGTLWGPGFSNGHQFIQWDFGAGNEQLPKDVQIRSRSDAGTLRIPVGWLVRGSNNGITWDTLIWERGQSWTGAETKTMTML